MTTKEQYFINNSEESLKILSTMINKGYDSLLEFRNKLPEDHYLIPIICYIDNQYESVSDKYRTLYIMLEAKYILETHGGVCIPFLYKRDKNYIQQFCDKYNYKMKMKKGVAYILYDEAKYLNQNLSFYEFTGANYYKRGYAYSDLLVCK